MSLKSLLDELEQIEGVSVANTVQNQSHTGISLHITLKGEYEGHGDVVLDRVLETIPRDILQQKYNVDERITISYDAIEISL